MIEQPPSTFFFFGAPERKTPFPLRRRSEEIEDFRRIVECSGGYRGDKTKLVDHVWVKFRWNHDWNITIIVVLEAFYMFTKWKNTFSKHFPCLQNDKTCFRSILQLYKMKKHVFETFRDYKKKNTFLKPFSAFSISWKTKTTSFWSAFHVYKVKNKFWKRFLSLQMKKARL